jgi:hypothetical protein
MSNRAIERGQLLVELGKIRIGPAALAQQNGSRALVVAVSRLSSQSGAEIVVFKFFVADAAKIDAIEQLLSSSCNSSALLQTTNLPFCQRDVAKAAGVKGGKIYGIYNTLAANVPVLTEYLQL